MNDKAGVAANQDYGRDEDAAVKALKKHKVLYCTFCTFLHTYSCKQQGSGKDTTVSTTLCTVFIHVVYEYMYAYCLLKAYSNVSKWVYIFPGMVEYTHRSIIVQHE